MSLLGVVTGNNPRADIYAILGRHDISGLLRSDLDIARQLARDSLAQAWPPDPSPYRARLEQDIEMAYAEAAGRLRQAAVLAFDSVRGEDFIPGITPPGENPAMDAARRRAEAVERAVAAAIWFLGFRNEMTVNVAATRHRAEEILAEGTDAGPGWAKKWECRKSPDGRPDARVCDWCRRMDALPAIPLDYPFPQPEPIGGRQPPRIYFDLQAPPLHPRCRCRIILVRAGAPGTIAVAAAPASFISAGSVRAMPDARYEALRSFHRAAVHELGQAMQRQYQEVGRHGKR